jgi:type IV pilus assembly protein PilM
VLFKSTKVIGLDIGTSFIKLAEIDATRKGATLVSFGIVPTPANSISSRGEIIDPAQVANVIQNLVKEVKSKRKNVATGMWGSAVMVKKISGPRMPEADLAANIKFEAEQYIPFDVNEINLDFSILGKKNQSVETMDYLLIAAQREYLFKLAEVVETAGLQCSIVDVSGFALANTFLFNHADRTNEVIGIINCGAGVTNFIVVENSDIVFARDIPVGGLNFTNDIHKQMGVSIEEAEALKISASTGQNVPQEVVEIVKSSLNNVIEEIHRGFDFYTATAGDAPIQRIFISGGSSLIPGFPEALSQLTSLPVERLNPFAGIGYNAKAMSRDYISQISPYASIAIGLSLRKADDR